MLVWTPGVRRRLGEVNQEKKSRIKEIGVGRCEPNMTERCSLWSALSAAACCFYRGSFMQVQVSAFFFFFSFCACHHQTYVHSDCTHTLSWLIFNIFAWTCMSVCLGWSSWAYSWLPLLSWQPVMSACLVVGRLMISYTLHSTRVSDGLCENSAWTELERGAEGGEGFFLRGSFELVWGRERSTGMSIYCRRVKECVRRAQ